MNTLRSHGIVRRIIKEDGAFEVSFHTHAGYFRVPASPNAPALKERLLKAQGAKEEISFTFDKELNILEVDLALPDLALQAKKRRKWLREPKPGLSRIS